MLKTGVVVLLAIAVLAGLATGVGALSALDLFSRKPDRPSGPLKVAVRELSLPNPKGAEGLPISVRVWAPQVTGASSHYPLIIYVPGWGGTRGESDVLLSDIASEGFVVAAADDVSHDQPDPSTDPTDEKARTASYRAFSPEDLAAFPDVSERRTRLGFNKVELLIEALKQIPSNAVPSTIDHSRLGVVGFSFGGAVAAVALVRDPRVAAAVNLDGWVVDTLAANGLSRPLLAIYAKLDLHPSPNHVSAASYYESELTREDFRVLLRLSRSSGTEVRLVDGAEHRDFSDARYADRWKRWRPWRKVIRSDRMRAIVEAYLISFLLHHVSDRPLAGVDQPSFSEVTSIEAMAGDLR